ncbi:LOW QUALITY PROTEIN: zinc finger and BTB domain-containing protein 7A [Alosa sapidissima]|uniref:LOW QUALITY PROTEIN: zinc finger and BTB domain-containing protein 7A n=1 Tax=Alosa sapidissima TaxID=34773 RepID=UPI001C091147|nr:LOW QUALITY PROTEIN: zinc finger and BTB domain-containing protein 7A [Alosa sapidissima]
MQEREQPPAYPDGEVWPLKKFPVSRLLWCRGRALPRHGGRQAGKAGRQAGGDRRAGGGKHTSGQLTGRRTDGRTDVPAGPVIGGSAASWWKMSSGAGGRGSRHARSRNSGGSCGISGGYGSRDVVVEEGPVGIPFPEHSADVLGGLNKQRLSGLLCDVLLVVQEQEFHAHRSVLASCSAYFHKLFTSGLAANHQSVYALDFVRAEALAALLDFAYTATLTVSHSSVADILSAARLLEISPVQDVCTHLLDTKVLSPPAGSEQDEEEQREDEERPKSGSRGGGRGTREQGNQLRAREYLEFFQRGAHWGSSSCSTPELRDPLTHQHFSQRNGAERNGTHNVPHEYDSPLALALAQPPMQDPEDDEEDEEDMEVSSAWARGNGGVGGEAVLPHYYTPGAQNGHFYLQTERVKLEQEQRVEAGDRERDRERDQERDRKRDPNNQEREPERGSASALLQQMMDSIERQKEREAAGEEPPDGEDPDVEFYLKYFNSAQQEEGSAAAAAAVATATAVSQGLLWSVRGGGGGQAGSGGGTGATGERKMRSKAFQKCPICSKVIQGAGKLPRHIRTHTGEKPYECAICKVRFTRQDKLKVHMRKHTGEKPYLCTQCGAAFAHNYDLKNHMRVHTGLRPYQCSSCFKTFVRSDHLHRHLKKDGCNGIPSRRGRKPRVRDPELLEGASVGLPGPPGPGNGGRSGRGRRRVELAHPPAAAGPTTVASATVEGGPGSHAHSPTPAEKAVEEVQ